MPQCGQKYQRTKYHKGKQTNHQRNKTKQNENDEITTDALLVSDNEEHHINISSSSVVNCFFFGIIFSSFVR